MVKMIVFPGVEDSEIDKSLANVRRLCVQNIRPWQEIGQPYHFHHVLAYYFIQHFYATVLLSLRFH